jgi:glycosyltransferase involved in cell wall biosynthesis
MKSSLKLIRITTVPISLKVLLRKQLKFMTDHYEVIGVSSPGKELEEVAIHEGVRTAAVSMTRSITPIKDLKALWNLYRFFKKENPSVVHTHTPKAGLLGMMAARLAGVPVRLHTVAGMPLMESSGKKRKVLEMAEKMTYRCATKVYPNSRNLAEFILQNKFCSSEKIKVLGNGSSNGIDMDYFRENQALQADALDLREKAGINESDFVFVFIGRLVRDKGIEELVDAFNVLHQKYNNIKLLLVGPFEPELDPISTRTQNIIEKDNNIIHFGFQHDVRPYYMISNALAFPSYREGFPNVPMQAGCFGLPSVVTDINGCNEIVEHEKNGLIIPVKDSNALREAMERLLIDKALFLSLQQNSRKMIESRYEQKYFWNLLLEEYKSLTKTEPIVSKISEKTV